VVARTQRSLLLADLQECRLSEVGWPDQGGEKFHFGNDKVGAGGRRGCCRLLRASRPTGPPAALPAAGAAAAASARPFHTAPAAPGQQAAVSGGLCRLASGLAA
jgi:hypothetical protein